MMARRRIFGILLIAASLLLAIPAIVLVNQQFSIVRVPWGVFDFSVRLDSQKDGLSISNTTVEAIFGISALILFTTGTFLCRRTFKNPI